MQRHISQLEHKKQYPIVSELYIYKENKISIKCSKRIHKILRKTHGVWVCFLITLKALIFFMGIFLLILFSFRERFWVTSSKSEEETPGREPKRIGNLNFVEKQ